MKEVAEEGNGTGGNLGNAELRIRELFFTSEKLFVRDKSATYFQNRISVPPCAEKERHLYAQRGHFHRVWFKSILTRYI